MLTIEKVNAQKYTVSAEWGKASERNEALKKLVWKHSHHVPGYQFTPKFQKGSWNGRVSVFTPANIRAGFLSETITHLTANNIEWEWKDGKEPEHLPYRITDKDPFTFSEFRSFCEKLISACGDKFEKKYNIKLEIRDYQIEAAFKAITQKTGIALHATSAGKSLTIAFILAFLFFKKLISKAVILVPLQSLVTQFTGDLMDFGFNENFVGQLYSKKKQIDKPITVAMINSVHNLTDTVAGKDLFENTDLVICDEVHKAAAKTVEASVLNFVNARYFFGCTGTLPEDALSRDIIFSLFGYVLDQRKLKELEEEYDAVSSVKVGILTFCYGDRSFMSRLKRSSSVADWRSEVEFLQTDDEFRNPYIVKTLKNNFESGKNVVALVKNIAYGVHMFDMLKKEIDSENLFSIFGSGEESKTLEERDEIISYCRSTKSTYLIVTNFQIFSTGINIPNLDVVAMIDAGKSKITVAQTIGRGVRRTKKKSNVIILDCSCDMKYGNRHGSNRKKLYIEEGFTVFEKKIEQKDLLN